MKKPSAKSFGMCPSGGMVSVQHALRRQDMMAQFECAGIILSLKKQLDQQERKRLMEYYTFVLRPSDCSQAFV